MAEGPGLVYDEVTILELLLVVLHSRYFEDASARYGFLEPGKGMVHGVREPGKGMVRDRAYE